MKLLLIVTFLIQLVSCEGVLGKIYDPVKINITNAISTSKYEITCPFTVLNKIENDAKDDLRECGYGEHLRNSKVSITDITAEKLSVSITFDDSFTSGSMSVNIYDINNALDKTINKKIFFIKSDDQKLLIYDTVLLNDREIPILFETKNISIQYNW
jgi:hypothetical protein